VVVRPLTRWPTGSTSCREAAVAAIPDDAPGSLSVNQVPLAASAAGRRTRMRRAAMQSMAVVLVITTANVRRS
jgi:hypothetical protein